MTIQDEIRELEGRLENLRAQQSRCPHDWGDIEYDPKITKAYSARSWQGPGPLESHPLVHIPRQELPRWKRECKTCGLTQYTERTKEVQRRGSLPGTTATEKVPAF